MKTRSQTFRPWIFQATSMRYNVYLLKYVTVLAKAHLVRTKTEYNFIATVYRHTQYLSIPSVSNVKF